MTINQIRYFQRLRREQARLGKQNAQMRHGSD